MALPTITVFGNINRKELRYIPSGKALCKFQIECSEKNTKGEWENLYLKGEVWDKQAEFVNQYFNDGDVIVVTGKLVTNVYEKQDGSKVYENKLLFPSVSFPPKAKDSNTQSNNQQSRSYQPAQNQPTQGEYQPQQSYQETQQSTMGDMDEDSIPFAPICLQYKLGIHSI